jgi:hypothetical protein
MTASHIHIHLGSVEPGTEVHLHFDGPEPDDNPAEPYETPEEAMLARMLTSARTGNMVGYADPDLIQKVHDELIGLGYQPTAPITRIPGRTPDQYLRWRAAGEGPTRAYLNTASLGFSRRDDMAKVALLRGARVKPDYVTFSIVTPQEAEQALAAAKAVL